MSFTSYLRRELPHIDAQQVILRVGPLTASYWVGFTSTGQPAEASRYVGLVVSLSEQGALRGAQRAYRRWYQKRTMLMT